MGEAGVHRKIEFASWNILDPKLSQNSSKTFESLSGPQQQALAIYAGNWMRDFSQVFVPVLFKHVQKMPRVIGAVSSPPIGPLGAESLIGSLLRAVAIQDFDVEIPNKVMTDENIGVYVPQEHIDNPAGLTLDDDLLVRTTPNQKSGEKGHYVLASNSKPQYREDTLNAAAFAGSLQIENKLLYNISPSGMNYFIFNTSEWIKTQFRESKKSRNIDDARMFFGNGLHGLEDYFAHSNFIEVAINLILKDADKHGLPSEFKKVKKYDQKRWVDTLYDKGNCDHITTGTFSSGLDTGVSIAYIFLSKMPVFFDIIDKGVDILLDRELDKILEIINKKKTLEKRRREFEIKAKKYTINYKGAEVLKILLDGMDKAKIKIPTFETATLPKDLHVTVPCIHLKAPHPNGDIVTVPCIHLKAPHPNGDIVTVPCIHKVVKHPSGHMKFGVKVPCMHWKLKHPNGDKKNVICTHKPVPAHPNGDRLKLSESSYGKSHNSLLGSKIPVGLKYESPTNAFKIYQDVNETGHKIWAHYVTIKDILDSANLPKQAKLWLATKWDDVTKEYREILRNHMKMILVLSLRLLIPGIPIQGVNESDGYKIKGDYTKALDLVKFGIDAAEINTFIASELAVRKDDKYLPPTHSEISKDHPKKNVKEKSHKYHFHGSIFYDIHFLLAKHAVQHVTIEMNKFSKERILIDHNISEKQIQKFLKLNNEVRNLFPEIHRESQDIGRTVFSDKNHLLFEVIDYYISHPSKTNWWREIIINYMKNNPRQIIDDIHQRNKTRKNRNKIVSTARKTVNTITNSKRIQTKSGNLKSTVKHSRRNLSKAYYLQT